jgi:hypothetical protein
MRTLTPNVRAFFNIAVAATLASRYARHWAKKGKILTGVAGVFSA